jgi:glutamate carboxypeptidase
MPEALVELLRELVEIESPTGDTEALRGRLAAELAERGAEVEHAGDHLYGVLPGEQPPLVVLGHLDTVWPLGTLASIPWRLENGRAYGPGSYDMKGGLVVLLEAIRRARTRHAVRVLLTADEEIGSPTARELLARAADGAAAAFVCEPPTAAGDLKTARKGIGRFRLLVSGRAAHAARGRARARRSRTSCSGCTGSPTPGAGSSSTSASSPAARERTSSRRPRAR